MAVQSAERLTDFLEDTVGSKLRSLIAYDEDGYEMVHLRADIEGVYAEETVDQIMQGARLEAFERPVIADAFADDHGGLLCQVKCFENVAEVNVTLTEAEGVAIAMDGGVFQEGRSLLAEIRRVAAVEFSDQE